MCEREREREREGAYLRVFTLVQAFAQVVLLATRRQSSLDFSATLVENRNLVKLQLQDGNKIGSGHGVPFRGRQPRGGLRRRVLRPLRPAAPHVRRRRLHRPSAQQRARFTIRASMDILMVPASRFCSILIPSRNSMGFPHYNQPQISTLTLT